jgi:valyl-tRNA synthetase
MSYEPAKSVIDLIMEIRTLRQQNDVDTGTYMTVVVEAESLLEAQTIFQHKEFIEHMAMCKLFFPYTLEEYEKMSET